MVCYGLIRFFGDRGCKITISFLLVYVMFEFVFILYAFNGQYNGVCRKKKFNENNLIQKCSFCLFLITSILLLITYIFIFGSRKEVISEIILKYNDTKFLIKNNYAIAGIVDSSVTVVIFSVIFGTIFYLTFACHYLYILFKMIIFIKEMVKLTQISNTKNDNLKKFKHHIISVIIPIIFLYIPIGIFFICVKIFNNDEYFWITKILSNLPMFFIYFYGVVSPCYVFYFIYTSELTNKKVLTKKIKNSVSIRK